MKTAVFAGTFDPPTLGHKSVVEKSLKIFDGVTVALVTNTAKNTLFGKEERLAMLKAAFGGMSGVKIISFDGAAVDLLRKENTPFYVRGVRDGIDFEYENRDYFASSKLNKDMVCIYLPAEQELLHISSSLIRNSIKFKKDYKDYVPSEIYNMMQKYLEDKNV